MTKVDSPLMLLVAGGTGGHVYPALALALEMRNRGLRIAWLGTNNGLEVKVASDEKIPQQEQPMHNKSPRGWIIMTETYLEYVLKGALKYCFDDILLFMTV